jgi:ribosomal protein S18 acetylase RimI-like enzyme
MTALAITPVTDGERDIAVASVVLAFSSDPLVRWIWPDARDYLTHMPALIAAFAGAAFGTGTALATADRSGIALWLPPGVEPDHEAMGALVGSTAPSSVLADLPGVGEQMAHYHPAQPHWYLPLVGVDPARQGAGYGTALMKHVTREFDRSGALAYLESTNPRNISLYLRHGFEVLGQIQVGSSPPIVPMVRRPATAE